MSRSFLWSLGAIAIVVLGLATSVALIVAGLKHTSTSEAANDPFSGGTPSVIREVPIAPGGLNQREVTRAIKRDLRKHGFTHFRYARSCKRFSTSSISCLVLVDSPSYKNCLGQYDVDKIGRKVAVRLHGLFSCDP